jgi:hypothetical protein
MSSESKSSTRKRKAPSSSNSDLDPKLALATAITGIKKSQDAFAKSVAQYKELEDKTFTELEIKLTAKRQDLDELDTTYNNRKKQRKLDLEHDLKEQGLIAAKKILEERGDLAVSKESYETLQRDHAALKAKFDDTSKSAIAEEKAKINEANKNWQRTVQLEYESKMAAANAENNQQKKQISVLSETIASLKEDMAAQRQLTKDVANSFKPTVVHDTGSRGRAHD